jgi:MFS superfamily sulfate permease-like transporter
MFMERPEEIIAAEQEKEREREIRRVYHLSRRAYWLTVLLGLVIPIGAYLYTRRWRAMVIFLVLAGFIAFIFTPENESEEWEPSPVLMIVAGIGATADNVQAIRWARTKIRERNYEI